MKHFKLYILLFFVRHRINRWFRSNNPSKSMIRKWEENLKKSSFYNNSSLPYPIVNKQLFMANFDAINTVNITKKEAFKVPDVAVKCRMHFNSKDVTFATILFYENESEFHLFRAYFFFIISDWLPVIN